CCRLHFWRFGVPPATSEKSGPSVAMKGKAHSASSRPVANSATSASGPTPDSVKMPAGSQPLALPSTPGPQAKSCPPHSSKSYTEIATSVMPPSMEADEAARARASTALSALRCRPAKKLSATEHHIPLHHVYVDGFAHIPVGKIRKKLYNLCFVLSKV